MNFKDEDEDYDDLSQKHLASIKRDTRVSLEDAAVRAAHTALAEFNPDWDEKAVLVKEMQRMAKRIEELEKKVEERSVEHLAAHLTHDKGYQAGRQDAADQAMTIALMKSEQPEQEPVALREALASALTSVYVCGRVWSAWGVGTMSEDDFIPASESDEVLDELVSAVTTPPKRKEWVGMEWEDIQQARQKCGSMVEAMQYINNWLKEKNHDN